MTSNIAEKNFWNYYAVAPWSSDQEAHDHRLRYWVGAISLGILSLGAYPAILGLVLLGEKIYKSLKGRVQPEPASNSAIDKTIRTAASIQSSDNSAQTPVKQTQANLRKTNAAQLPVENGFVTDMNYYPPMLGRRERNDIKTECKNYVEGTTIGPNSFKLEPLEEEPSMIPLEERKDVDYIGKIEIVNRGGGLVEELILNPYYAHFERTDGVNWRQFLGDMFVEVQYSEMQQRGLLGWANADSTNMDLPIRSLPTQLFYGKKVGDIVEFKYKGKGYALKIEQEMPIDQNLQILDSQKELRDRFNPFTYSVDKNIVGDDPYTYPFP